MIPIPAGWRHHHGVHLVSMYPPGGGGRLRYYERLPEARTFAIVERVLAADDDFRATAVVEPRTFLTSEGEHGVIVELRGVRRQGRVRRSVAVVHTDEFAAALDTLIVTPERAEELELKSHELMAAISFGLGLRRRRFVYRPPRGWWAIPAGLSATWHPPGFPAEPTQITVQAAAPRPDFHWHDTERQAFYDEAVAGIAGAGALETEVIEASASTRHEVRWFKVAGERATREIVLLYRPPYLYELRMETAEREREDELHALFLAVATSIEPVPAAQDRQITPVTPRSSASTDYWAD